MSTAQDSQQSPPPSGPRFAVGAKVRVRQGVPDPEFDDIPLGGWAGTIAEVDCSPSPPLYLVEWSQETLRLIHPVYRHRCDRQGLEYEHTWLEETALVAEDGSPLVIEPPTKLIPLPLNRNEPEDVARLILGLSSDDPLPPLETSALERFRTHLLRRLRFPFPAVLVNLEGTEAKPVSVRRLLPVSESGPENGLYVEVQPVDEESIEVQPLYNMAVGESERGSKELQAYDVWFESTLPKSATQEGSVDPPLPAFLTGKTLLYLLTTFGLLGGLVGAVYMVIEGSNQVIQIGALVVGLLGGLVGALAEQFLRAGYQMVRGFLFGTVAGMLLGGVLGALLGTFLIVYVGAIPGAMLGTVLHWILGVLRMSRPAVVPLTLGGAYLGGMAYVFALDSWIALIGCSRGALVGAIAPVPLLVLMSVWLALILPPSDNSQ